MNKYIRIKDNDIASKPPISLIENIPLIVGDNGQVTLDKSKIKKLCSKMKTLIQRNNLFAKWNLKPEAFFAETNCDNILLYHDEYDVFTAKGLLRWQHKVFDQASRFIQKFKVNKQPTIDINAKQELKTIKNKNKQAIISANVS